MHIAKYFLYINPTKLQWKYYKIKKVRQSKRFKN